jgi:hypothetical protein
MSTSTTSRPSGGEGPWPRILGHDLQGYRRENGRVGVRNHVVILPVDDISNAACEAVANNIKGTMALPACLWPVCSSARISTCISAP